MKTYQKINDIGESGPQPFSKNLFLMKKHRFLMKKYRKFFFFEKIENYENYIFGKKEKAAFRYADREKSKKIQKIPDFFWTPGPDRTSGPGYLGKF